MSLPGSMDVDASSVSSPSPTASSPSRTSASGPSTLTVASTGLEFFEYRRACFLAGAPLPEVSTSSSSPAAPSASAPPPHYNPPPSYTLPPPPPPAPSVPYAPSPTSAIGRLESLLVDFCAPADELRDPALVAWHGGVGTVHRNLTGSKRLSKGLRLGLVIRILRAGWVKDGTWPCGDDGLPVYPPSSPEMRAVDADEVKYPPPHENRVPRRVDARTIRGPRRPVVPDAVCIVVESPPKEKSTFGSRLAALTSSFLNGGSSSTSSSSWSIGPSSAVLAGTDSPMPASPLLSEGPTARQVAPMPGRRRLERV